MSSMMKSRILCAGLLTAVTCGLALLVSGGDVASQSQAESQYPEPRFPRFLVTPSDEQMMDAARAAVRQTSGRSPLGRIQDGQNVHVFLSYDQDPEVWKAIRQAWAERGVEAIAIHGWEWTGMTREQYEARAKANILDGNSGWKEFGVFEPAYVRLLPEDVQDEFGNPMTTTTMLGGLEYPPKLENSDLKKFLDSRPDVKRYFAFGGGGSFVRKAAGPEHREKFQGNWIYFTKFDLLSKIGAFPPDVWKMIDEHIVRPIPHVAEGKFHDPQGTRLHWTLTPEQSAIWEKRSGLTSYSPGHLNIYPSAINATWEEGVIAGTANHTAYHPHMEIHLSRHGRIEKILGGGKTGDLFRSLVNHPKFANAHFPSAPEKGYWYLTQDGLGTNPKVVRNMDFLTKGSIELPNISERDRAGVQHFSFASPIGTSPGPGSGEGDVAYAQANDIPVSHTAHMHVYFGTSEWKLRDTGEWISVIEKGRLSAFDNPEVRALAARYGDPDVLFSSDWVPAIPGVNIPGDYKKDFAKDPWGWIKSAWERIKGGTYGYYVEDYDMFAASRS